MNSIYSTAEGILTTVNDVYVKYQDKVAFRICNDMCEYLSITEYIDSANIGNLRLGVSNNHPYERILDGYEVRSANFPCLSLLSSFYIISKEDLIGTSLSTPPKYVQSGDIVYLCTKIKNELVAIGYKSHNSSFAITKVDELLSMMINTNIKPRILTPYEWQLERVPIFHECILAENMDTSNIPNTNTLKYSDTLIIRWVANGELLNVLTTYCSSSLTSHKTLQLEGLIPFNRSCYWMILECFCASQQTFPNWYKLKHILKSKYQPLGKNISSPGIVSFCFLEVDSIKNLPNSSLVDLYPCFKLSRILVRKSTLVSDTPAGWDNILDNSQNSACNSYISTSSFEPNKITSSNCIGGYVFNHAIAELGRKTTSTLPIKPLSSFTPKVQEQLLLEDILNSFMGLEGMYIKATEHIFFPSDNFTGHSYERYLPETIFIISSQSKDVNLMSNDICVSLKISLSTFIFHIVDDPENNPLNIEKLQEQSLDLKSSMNLSSNIFGIKVDDSTSKITNMSDPMAYPLTYRILQLSALYRRILQYLNIHENNNQFGIISQTLCNTFREFLKQFTLRVSQLETTVRQGQVTLQSMWNQIQHAMTTFNVLDLIAIQSLGKKGGHIINAIINIIENHLHGEILSLKIAKFLLQQVCQLWIKYFLYPWLSSGSVIDYYDEFSYKSNKEHDKIFKGNTSVFGLTKLITEQLPTLVLPVKAEIKYIGKVQQILRNHEPLTEISSNNLKVIDILNVLNIDSMESDLLMHLASGIEDLSFVKLHHFIQNLYKNSKTLLYQFSLENYDIWKYLNYFSDLFFCYNDQFIQEFIDSTGLDILGGGLSGKSSFVHACKAWNDTIMKYYRINDQSNANGSLDFVCSFNELLLPESIKKVNLLIEDECTNFSSEEIDLYIDFFNNNKHDENTSKAYLPISHEAFKHFTLEFRPKLKLMLLFWPKKIVRRYQIIFRLILQIKYILSLLNNVWTIHQTISPLWEYVKGDGLTRYLFFYHDAKKSYSLRQRMLILMNGILQFIMYDAIQPLWNSFLSKKDSISSIEQFVSCQDDMLDSILKRCFCTNETIHSFYKLLSICHLYCRHSILFNRYGVDKLAAKTVGQENYLQNETADNFHEITINRDKFSQSYRNGRFSFDKSHLEKLILDSSFQSIVEKFNLNFEKLAKAFFELAQSYKNQDHWFYGLILKSDFNNFYQSSHKNYDLNYPMEMSDYEEVNENLRTILD
ncbi:Spc97 / Spc98 family protein [Cryptosporidium serpentis]